MVSIDYLNAFDRLDRCRQDGMARCKKGKPCNGRCIPKGHKCGGVESAGIVAGAQVMTAAKWSALIASSVVRYKVGQVVLGGMKKARVVNGANEARKAAAAAVAAGDTVEAAKQRRIAREMLRKGRTAKNVGRHTKFQQATRRVKSLIPHSIPAKAESGNIPSNRES